MKIESNNSFASSGFPEELIDQVDNKWESSDPNVRDSFAYNLIHNSASDVLRSFMEIDQKSESQFKYCKLEHLTN